MRKLTLLLTIMLLASLGAAAKSLVFTLGDGTKVYYLLGGETNPMLRFVDGKMTVDTDEYELSNIKNFYISEEDDPNAIEPVLTRQNVSFSANTLVINDAQVKAVKVYTVDGAAVKADVQQVGDVISVNLNGLAKGAYIVNVGKSSFKVMKK
ncbi:MAG: T9SS type A sorting domain-containing protein [Bacteroidaceae bacterium]|nr:T9SS type A sorting domain-containing protein [Bacteroidaceae bacterium]